jgi:hypothetical protein
MAEIKRTEGTTNGTNAFFSFLATGASFLLGSATQLAEGARVPRNLKLVDAKQVLPTQNPLKPLALPQPTGTLPPAEVQPKTYAEPGSAVASHAVTHPRHQSLRQVSGHKFVITDGSGQQPELTLYVNPTDIDVSFSHRHTSMYARGGAEVINGHVMSPWGEELTTLNVSGVTGAFTVRNSAGGYEHTALAAVPVGGIEGRRVSLAYQKLRKLIDMYRQNGYIRREIHGSKRIWQLGMVRVQYGVFSSEGEEHPGMIDYWGHFNSFTVSESQDQPYMMNFNFEFTRLADGNHPERVTGHVYRPGKKQ